MIEFKESSKFWHLWFVSADGVDWLAALFKHQSETWQCVYRFRYHKDAVAFDSKDERSWYTITSKSQDEEPPLVLVKTIPKIARMIANHYKGVLHSIPVRGNGLQAAEKLLAEPWAHARPGTNP
jgi:hypothetical protein